MLVLCTICARGGSKGIPKKNIKLLNKKPLISYSINHAFDFSKSYNSVDIALSTDDNEIKEISSKYGLKTSYTRPDELSSDNTGKIEALKHVLNYYENLNKIKYDIILDLDVSSPLRTQKNLQSALKKLLDDKNAIKGKILLDIGAGDCALTRHIGRALHMRPVAVDIKDDVNSVFAIMLFLIKI